ncbi:MAG TPA: VOC family protein [Candidatus Limnocylindria bacterium]|nr:VOC family protein [Candidatus Limnocylindria bacterium]
MRHGEFTHIELPADDPQRATRFYTQLFGWSFQEPPGFEGYHLFTTPAGEDGMGGAVGKRGELAPEATRTYVNVDSVDDCLGRIAQLGGSVVSEKQEVPGLGWFAVFRDPEGNELALWQRAPGRDA